MARLPVYVNNRGFDTGAGTFRPLPSNFGQAIGRGLADLGEGLQDKAKAMASADKKAEALAKAMASADKKAEARAEALAERDRGYRTEIELQKFRTALVEYEGELASNMADDGNNHAAAMQLYADKLEEKWRQSPEFARESPAKISLLFERIKSDFVERAIRTERDQRFKFRAQVNEDVLGRLTGDLSIRGAAGLDDAMKEWTEFNQRTEGGSKFGQRFLAMGIRRLQLAAVAAEARNRPDDFVTKVQSLASNVPSAATDNPMISSILKHAPAHGLDPRTMAAIGWIESRLNPLRPRPKRKDGSDMSSAEGGWQILDRNAKEYGLLPGEKFDPEKSTAAVVKQFAHDTEALKRKGYEATPGQIFLMWNLGGSAAPAVLRANPNTPIEDVIRSVHWKDPEYAETVLRNNPSMYREGMTVGEVLRNYENKMREATMATEKFFGGGSGQFTTEQYTKAISDFMGRPIDAVNPRDVADIFTNIETVRKTQSEKERRLERGNYFLLNRATANVHSTEDRKAINEAVNARYDAEFVQKLAQGDEDALVSARKVVQAAGFVPDRIVHGYRAAIDSKNPQSTMLALQSLSEISQQNPRAYGATKLEADEKKMVDEFRAHTEAGALDPSSAVKRILQRRTPEGAKIADAMAARVREELRNGARTQTQADDTLYKELQSLFDESIFSTPGAINDATKALLVDTYKDSILHHSLDGHTLEDAKKLAKSDLDKAWGVSNVADTTKRQALMPFAPEKVYAGQQLNGSYDWIKEQAKNYISSYLFVREKRSNIGVIPDANDFALIPEAGAAAKLRSGEPIGYVVWYKDRNGRVQLVEREPFVPDFNAANRADEDASKQRRQINMERQERNVIDQFSP